MKRSLLALALLALTGCGAPQAGAPDPTYACGDYVVPLSILTKGLPATQLGADGQAALKGHEVRPPKDLDKWRIIEETGERLAIISEDPRPHRSGDGTLVHGFLLVERFGPADAEGRPSWHMRSSGCTLRRQLDGLGAATLTLDPAKPAEGNTLGLLVTEQNCTSGQPATGRIQVVNVEETDQEVRLIVGVSPLSGSGLRTCQGNPPTSFTVELSQPLGNRTVRDVGVYPAQEVKLPVRR